MVNCPGMAVDRQFSFPMRNEMFATRGQKVHITQQRLTQPRFCTCKLRKAISRLPVSTWLHWMCSAEEKRACSLTMKCGKRFNPVNRKISKFKKKKNNRSCSERIRGLGRLNSFDALSPYDMDKVNNYINRCPVLCHISRSLNFWLKLCDIEQQQKSNDQDREYLLTMDVQANIDILKKTYESVEDIDLYVGIMLEKVIDPTALVSRQ